MISLLFHCLHCEGATDSLHFPLCAECAALCLDCPALCTSCGAPSCPPEECQRPWLAETSVISTYDALYLAIEPGYSVLRKWKKAGGPLFDQRVLKWDISKRDAFIRRAQENGASAIVPMPQRIQRSWRMGRSPAETLALWLSRETGLPLKRHLKLPSVLENTHRQAQLSMQERLASRLRFEVAPQTLESTGSTVILVDDFLTSGHTARSAARVLREGGFGRVLFFCLGARPRKIFRQSEHHLVESRARAISIR